MTCKVVRKGNSLLQVHREEVREIVESQTCYNSLIDEYRQVCFDFQVFENPMKTEECQNSFLFHNRDIYDFETSTINATQ